MKKKLIGLYTYLRNHYAIVYKILLCLVAVSLIVYALPKKEKFKYEYQKLLNKPWPYESLIAPFDFSIKKTEDELTKEKDQIIREGKLYFKKDVSVLSAQERSFEDIFDQTVKDYPSVSNEQFLDFGIDLLDSIYSVGVISLTDELENKPADFSLMLLTDNEAEEIALGDLFTVQTAGDFFDKKLSKLSAQQAKVMQEMLVNCITPNVSFDKETTDKVLSQALQEISPSRDKIVKDLIIISKGEILNEGKYQILESLKVELEESSNVSKYWLVVFGQFVLVSLCILILMLFISIFRNDIFNNNQKILFILLLIVLFSVATGIAARYKLSSLYLLPFCILPILIRAFFDTRLALFVHIITMLVVSMFAPNRFEFMFMQIIAGMVAIFSIVNLRNRSQIFFSAIVIFASYTLSFLSLNMVYYSSVAQINFNELFWFGLSALLTLITYPLIFVFEKTFGFVSDVSMMELADTNSGLLRELAAKAPGTFQHSLQVANLAEEAIYQIGGNALLVRTGALYHDIGKMDAPMYFVENQSSGINPHDELNFEESANIIINHVINGIEKARKHGIPEQIIDFIRTHHGTSKTNYFYLNYIKLHPDEEISDSAFRYPGPIPFSKETAVLMMADAVEASSRSLKKYDSESIEQLVDRIIDSQIQEQQFVNSDITFRDINTIKKIFKKKLKNIYHIRLEYPQL